MSSLIRLSDDSVFDKVHAFTAYWERDFGDYTDSKIDRGGLTKNGLTLKTMKELGIDLNKDGTVDKKDLLQVTPEIAKKVFKHLFWDEAKAYCCPPMVAMAYYDFSVNSGPGNAAYQLQKAINRLKPGTIPELAKNLGPKTRAALLGFSKQENYKSGNELTLALEFLTYREDFVREIVRKDSSQKGNLKGWLNRVSALQKFLIESSYYCSVK